jgi:hypothetical protein
MIVAPAVESIVRGWVGNGRLTRNETGTISLMSE